MSRRHAVIAAVLAGLVAVPLIAVLALRSTGPVDEASSPSPAAQAAGRTDSEVSPSDMSHRATARDVARQREMSPRAARRYRRRIAGRPLFDATRVQGRQDGPVSVIAGPETASGPQEMWVLAPPEITVRALRRHVRGVCDALADRCGPATYRFVLHLPDGATAPLTLNTDEKGRRR